MRKSLLLLFVLPIFVHAQTLPAINDKVKNLKAFPGFLNYYWSDSSGKVYLEINKLDEELLYQTSLPAGLGSNDIGLDRGIMGTTSIVKFVRVANKVLMVQPNYGYRAVTSDAAEKRAVE